MKGRLLLVFLGIFLLLAGCSGNSDQASAPSNVEPESTQAANPQTFDRPLIAQAGTSPSRSAVPGLLQPTNAKARSSVLSTGRRDPFAAVPGTAMIVPSRRISTKVDIAVLPSSAKSGDSKLPTIPLPGGANLPVAPLPNLGNSPLPPMGVPAAPAAPPSPTALAEAVEVTGVVQVSGKWNVIVKESTAASSRYVAVGDYLENGKVLVKKISSPNGLTPVVILQQNGVEIRKSLV